jgi:hypothetical protein
MNKTHNLQKPLTLMLQNSFPQEELDPAITMAIISDTTAASMMDSAIFRIEKITE